MLPIVMSILAGSASFATGALLQSRTIQSQAVCTSEFVWMDNAEQSSPCEVAAQIDAICNGGTWIVPALAQNGSNTYDIPDGATATFCTCSWASYNLISACTACQGADLASKIVEWTVYSANCAGKLSNTYFPSNITLSSDVTIPFWAGENPTTTWTNGLFSVPAAQQIANQSHPDLTGTVPTTPKKSSNIGAIVGGVVGGLVVIAVAAAIAFYILRRQRKLANPGPPPSIIEKPLHMRSISDLTANSALQGYTTLSSTPMYPPTSPTILTHNTSVRSVPYSSVVQSTLPYGSASPPPGRQAASPPPRNREDVIEPFTLPPVNGNVSDRKQANGAYPIYDAPTAPPPSAMRMEITRPVTPTQRARFNPPAYAESTPSHSGTASPPPSRPNHRGKQGSTDTLQSLTSSRSHGQRPAPAHSPNSSGSGMNNIMGITNPAIPNNQADGSAVPQGHGRQVSASSDEKRRPTVTEDSISGRDLA